MKAGCCLGQAIDDLSMITDAHLVADILTALWVINTVIGQASWLSRKRRNPSFSLVLSPAETSMGRSLLAL